MSYERLAEEKIREAMEAGAFDRLKGAGKPLPKTDDDLTGDDWAGLHLLRSNGFLPEWLELRKQAYERREEVRQAFARWEAALRRYGSPRHPLVHVAAEDYRLAAKAINAIIDLHNLRCPSIHFEIARFNEEARPEGA